MIGKQKVLIVDDDENIAELISLYLIKECYDTRTVGSGEEALQIFDVCLLYTSFSYFFTIFSFTIAHFNKNQIKYMYLTRIMSLTPVTNFSCQEITKGLSNSCLLYTSRCV